MQRWTVRLEGGPRRVNHAAVAIGRRIFSFGGYCTSEEFNDNRPMDVHVLNTITYKWTALPVATSKSDLSECPYQRYGHTAVAWADNAYVWGGRNDDTGCCNVLYCFNTATLKWSRCTTYGLVPGARDGHSACVLGNLMYIFGGYVADMDEYSNELHALDFTTMTWSVVKTRGKPPSGRDFHSATAIGNQMYLFGGRSHLDPYNFLLETYCNQIKAFDSVSQTWQDVPALGPKPCGRRSHSAFLYKGALYVFGGYNGEYDLHYGDLHKFDVASGRWSSVKVTGPSPGARRRQCCCLVKDKLFLFGGTCPISWPFEGIGSDSDLLDLADLHVLDFAPTLKTLCLLRVLEERQDQSVLPHDLRWELSAMVTNSSISRPMMTSG
ncbi:hypothetical protein CAPTEDRAFT_2628 [Capitella teleta]|uniref:Kelch domain-containing protein 3 n=1 Tax=Capitella teleta TaxID=283909 RepID=R7TKG4_CAPTE|nr:hypothetical protein CAPTEDRAFT_2628 [Capitella teleta]|eukprot:ELT93982.1 hypothetical protein CAPTEDRAFT_2628 [Capitella teleta]